MSRQFGRNAPRTTAPSSTTANLDGNAVSVHGDAVRSFSEAATSAAPDSGLAVINSAHDVRALRDAIGVEGIRRAAIDAGRTPPSDRTIRRWVASNRIPHDVVADRVDRRALVASQGGVKAFAAKVGLSESSIRRYQRGATTQFRKPQHQQAATAAKTQSTLARAGVADGQGNLIRSPKISVDAAFEYKNNGKTSGDYRSSRDFDISNMSSDNARDFAAAIANEDHASAIAVVERHLTEDYASTFDGFDDDTGFHMTHVSEFDINWE